MNKFAKSLRDIKLSRYLNNVMSYQLERKLKRYKEEQHESNLRVMRIYHHSLRSNLFILCIRQKDLHYQDENQMKINIELTIFI